MPAETSTKRKVSLCPTCGQPTHRDPVTKRFTRHPDDLPPPAAPEPAPLPKRKRGLFRRRAS